MERIDVVHLDGLAKSGLGWFVQRGPGDEWWLPGRPALLKLRCSVGYFTAVSVEHNREASHIDVGFKTATFSYMPSLKHRLWSRMQLTRRLEATDPRDKLYAFLGMSSEDVADEPLLQVDYNSSVADVYTNLAMFFFQRLMCLDALEFVNDMPTKKPRLANLPSWAADLSLPTNLELFKPAMYFNAGGAFKFDSGRFPMHVLRVRASTDRKLLDLDAYLVGEVTELALLPHHYKENDHLTGNAGREEHENVNAAASRTYGVALDMIIRLGQSTRNGKDVNIENPALHDFPTPATFDMQSRLYLTGQSMFEVFWRCLVCDSWTWSTRPGKEDPIVQDEDKAYMEGHYRKYHAEMIAKGSIPVGLELPGRHGDATSERFGSPEPTPTMAFAFATEFEPKARTRVFGAVADELIGWFPRRAEKGDMLVILPGARCPYVLRKVPGDAPTDWDEESNEGDAARDQDQQSKWEVIGHAYVQGLMDDVVSEWELDLTENGKRLLSKLSANGEAPAVERICLV